MRRTATLAVALFVCCGNVHNELGPDWIRHVIADGFPTQTVVAADFTGDGRLDVITGDITPGHERTILYVAPGLASRYHPGLVYWLEQPQGALGDSLAWFRIPKGPLTASKWERYPLVSPAKHRPSNFL